MTVLSRSLQLLTRDTVLVRYITDGQSIPWRVRPGTSQVEQVTDSALVNVARLQDFVGPLPIGRHGPIEPGPGDRVEWDRNGQTDIFEVLPAVGEDYFAPVDAYGQLYRVHTKLTGFDLGD